jgi:hypothetical protein
LSFLLARRSKIPFRFLFMNIIIICLLIITIWKPCGQHGDSFNHRLWSWLVISFPMALLPLPLLLLASCWHTQESSYVLQECTSWQEQAQISSSKYQHIWALLEPKVR